MKTKVRYKIITSLYRNAGRRDLPCIPTIQHYDCSKKLSKPSGLKNLKRNDVSKFFLTSPPSHNWIKLGIIMNAKNSVVKFENKNEDALRMEEKIGAEEPNFAKTRNLLTSRFFSRLSQLSELRTLLYIVAKRNNWSTVG